MDILLFWDLDGTLTDSSEGITKCVKNALEQLGITGYELKDLLSFIGPPLRKSFPEYGVKPEQIEEAVFLYRQRYKQVGKFENKPYDGIDELLKKIKAAGFRNFVATSKPEQLSKEIMDKYELSQYFEIICGSTEDGSISSKEDVIEYLLSKISGEAKIYMIGDTVYDVVGANSHNIPTIGVSWGFGNLEEMKKAGAEVIVDSMDELFDYLVSAAHKQ